MPIVFNEKTNSFKLDSVEFSYVFRITEEKMLYHIYYGGYVPDTDLNYLTRIAQNYVSSTVEHPNRSNLSRFNFEYTPFGSGSFCEPALMVRDKNSNPTCDIRYRSHRIFKGKETLCSLPSAFVTDENDATSLDVYCEDPGTGLNITLRYTVFEKLNVLVQSVLLENKGESELEIDRVMSGFAELPQGDYDMISLPGAWGRERDTERLPLRHGQNFLDSLEGRTSHSMNNFYAVCAHNATEDFGEVYGSCLVYSGNFLSGAYKNDVHGVRMMTGINPLGFAWKLAPGTAFEAPEALLVYSTHGIGAMSHTYHDFFRKHIIRSKWCEQPRPVLINNWEATYFKFDDEKLLEIARQARESGLDMLVMDDGWFGKRDDDYSGLGDWFVNENKLKGGLRHLVERVNALGMKFGIWFEPEMVSPDSELYRAHPDWCLHVAGRERHLARMQLVLDYSRSEVRDYIYGLMKSILSSANIEYVKWDHNRGLSEVGNELDESAGQMSLSHKNVCGLYEVQKRLTEDFPDLLLENCASGGGRFDAGMLQYSPQIWTSDNTDAFSRLSIQYGTSLCYPCSSFGSHVSVVPNHQTGRVIPFDTRAAVAMSGTFGYELDITKLSDEDKAKVKSETEMYKKYCPLVLSGDYYRLKNPGEGNFVAWQFVSKDKSETVAEYVRIRYQTTPVSDIVRLKGLDADAMYEADDGRCYSGSLLMRAGIPVSLDLGDMMSLVMHFTKAKYK